MFKSAFKSSLARLSSRQDMLLVSVLVLTVAMMILPMPTVFADMLIVISIGIATILMMVAVYIRTPVEFSTLPSIILISTAFRLSLSITTSRMVLVQADAGAIIRTFGNFVIAGNVVVGLVIYLIITIVQFVVITKGSERVAEVAARFSLDALPGQQVSIDADLRNGDINQAEARRRRTVLQKESQLYGSMDGAMKFVKGDAIASLIIIVVNLIGGITIGCVQHGMDFGQAVDTYSLLAVGDGLIAQIPALLISLTAGIVVTRISSEDGSNLGRDIVGQLAAEPRTLQVAAAVLAGMAFVPGFPTAVFLCFAVLLAGTTQILAMVRKRDKASAFQLAVATENARPVAVSVVLHLGPDLLPIRAELDRKLTQARDHLSARLGMTVPPLRLAPDTLSGDLRGFGFRVDVDAVPTLSGELDPSIAFVENAPEALNDLGIAFNVGTGPFGATSLIVDRAALPLAKGAGLVVADVADYLRRIAERTLLAHAERLIGIQETKAVLMAAETHVPELVRETMRVCPLPRMSDVLRLLVDEQVPINHIRQVLETAAEWAPREQTTGALVEHVRGALRRQICHAWSAGQKVLNVMAVEASLEEALRATLHQTPKGIQLALDQASSQQLVQFAREQLLAHLERDRPAVVLVAPDLRRPLRGYLRAHGVDVPVLSYTEIAPEFSVQVFATLSLTVVSGLRKQDGGRPNIRLVA